MVGSPRREWVFLLMAVLSDRGFVWSLALGALALVVFAVLAPLGEWARILFVAMEGWHYWGIFSLMLILAVWNIFLPPMPLQLLAAYVYGPWWSPLPTSG